jgi:hypothetical protein
MKSKRNWENYKGEIIVIVAAGAVLIPLTLAMALGIGPFGPPKDTSPHAKLQFDVQSSTSVKIIFIEIIAGRLSSYNPPPSDIKLIITNTSNQSDVVEIYLQNPPDASTVRMSATGGASAEYTDMNFQENEVNKNDFIVVSNLGQHTTYSVIIYEYSWDSSLRLDEPTTFTLD